MLCKVVKKNQTCELVDHIKDPEIRDFVDKAMHCNPEMRLTCKELLSHPFLKIKPDDKDVDVTTLHTLTQVIKEEALLEEKLPKTTLIKKAQDSSIGVNQSQ